MKFLRPIGISLIILLLFNNCEPDTLKVDVSDVPVANVKLLRLDKDIFSLNDSNITSQTKILNTKYGNFYNRFISSIINKGGVNDTTYEASLFQFINDKDMQKAYNETQTIFTDKDFSLMEAELTESLKRFKFHFENRKTPVHFVAYFSGFNYNIVYADSTIGIGLDMYMGHDNEFYKMLQWPQYKVNMMSKEYIVTDAVRGWLITEFDNSEPINNLLNHMIFYGKILYACDALLPDKNDSLKIGYTTQQIAYCKTYEKNLWGFFAEKNRLYENNMKTIAEFTNEGPFTGAISKECPPRIAMWIGWQIVKNYMKNNKNISLNDLMNEKDAQKILSKSKYRP